MTITEFLNARYDEDETLAQESIIDASHWSVFAVNEHFGQVDSDDGAIANNVDLKDAAHIVRWDPARVLADIAAKRAIMEAHPWECADPYESWRDDAHRERYGDTRGNRNCKTCGGTASHPNFPAGVERRDSWPCMTLRLLAQPFAEHPDFDPAWRMG